MAEVIRPFGDSALLVTLGDRPDPGLSTRARAIAAAIDESRDSAPGLGRSVPAHASVLVPFDPLVIERSAASARVRRAIADVGATQPGQSAAEPVTEIRVRYGGSDGPDLAEVADRCGLTPAEVIERHASARHEVLFLGFAPGFAYLGGLPAQLVVGRRASPRERVPAGSVAIAGEHTGVYPLAMPGGWNLIGRTGAVLFDPERADPALLRPGAIVRFVPER
jgi:KipI family sensor histidine kinase inhibitor